MLVNKGLLVHATEDILERDNSSLGLTFLSLLHYLRNSWRTELAASEHDPNRFSKKHKEAIEKAVSAYEGLYHDLHGLAIQADMIDMAYQNRRGATRHKDFLYVMEYMEKYFANLRSMYDFLAMMSAMIVDPKKIGQIEFGSFHALIKEAKKETSKLPKQAVEVLKDAEKSFMYVRGIRDKIIHGGVQLDSTLTGEDGYYLKNVKNKDGVVLESITLHEYLSELTLDLFKTADELSEIIFNEYQNLFSPISWSYVAISGVCIPAFVRLLGLEYTAAP